MDKEVNIVIVSCGRPLTLNACLRCIERNTEVPYYVTIVNNTFPHLKEAMQRHYDVWLNKHPDWKLVDGTDNYILQSKNIGIRARPNAKHHVVLDDDVFVTKEWLSRMVGGLKDHEDFGIIVPLLNFTPNYFWPEQVAWLPDWIANSLHYNNEYSEKFLQKVWNFHEKYLLPKENVFRPVANFEFSCVLTRKAWLYDEILGLGRCGWAGNIDLALQVQQENLKVAVCRSVIVLHCIRGSITWDPRYREDLRVDYFREKWGEKSKGIHASQAGPIVAQQYHARQNMLKGALPDVNPGNPEFYEIQREQINTPEYWDNLWKEDRIFPNEGFIEEIKDGTKVIDIGGGWGNLAADIKTRNPNCEVHTLDFSQTAHQKGKEKYGHLGLKFLTLPFEELQGYENYFDYAVAREFLEHVSDFGVTMTKVLSILKPGGVFIASVPHDEEVQGGSQEHMRGFSHESYHRFVASGVAKWVSFAPGDCPWRILVRVEKQGKA